MWDLIVLVPDHCLSFYLNEIHIKLAKHIFEYFKLEKMTKVGFEHN